MGQMKNAMFDERSETYCIWCEEDKCVCSQYMKDRRNLGGHVYSFMKPIEKLLEDVVRTVDTKYRLDNKIKFPFKDFKNIRMELYNSMKGSTIDTSKLVNDIKNYLEEKKNLDLFEVKNLYNKEIDEMFIKMTEELRQVWEDEVYDSLIYLEKYRPSSDEVAELEQTSKMLGFAYSIDGNERELMRTEAQLHAFKLYREKRLK